MNLQCLCLQLLISKIPHLVNDSSALILKRLLEIRIIASFLDKTHNHICLLDVYVFCKFEPSIFLKLGSTLKLTVDLSDDRAHFFLLISCWISLLLIWITQRSLSSRTALLVE